MRALAWFLRLAAFVALFGLALKNSGPVDLHFYLGATWQAPLSLVLLAAFVVGTLVGLSVTIAPLVRQRREVSQLRARLREGGKGKA